MFYLRGQPEGKPVNTKIEDYHKSCGTCRYYGDHFWSNPEDAARYSALKDWGSPLTPEDQAIINSHNDDQCYRFPPTPLSIGGKVRYERPRPEEQESCGEFAPLPDDFRAKRDLAWLDQLYIRLATLDPDTEKYAECAAEIEELSSRV